MLSLLVLHQYKLEYENIHRNDHLQVDSTSYIFSVQNFTTFGQIMTSFRHLQLGVQTKAFRKCYSFSEQGHKIKDTCSTEGPSLFTLSIQKKVSSSSQPLGTPLIRHHLVPCRLLKDWSLESLIACTTCF